MNRRTVHTPLRAALALALLSSAAVAQTVPHDVTLPDAHVSTGTRYPYQFAARGDVAVATEALVDGAEQVVQWNVHALRRQSDGSWAHEQTLTLAAPPWAVAFESAVAVQGDTIIVAMVDSQFPLAVFTYTNGAWSLPQYLPFPTATPGSLIGSVHLDNARLVASEVVFLPTGHTDVFLLEFARTAGVWTLVSRALVSPPTPGFFLGDDLDGERYAVVYLDFLSFFGTGVSAAVRNGAGNWDITHDISITNFNVLDVHLDETRLHVHVADLSGATELRVTDISTPGTSSFTTAIDTSWPHPDENVHVDFVRDGVAVVSGRALANAATGRTVVYARRADETWAREFEFAADVPGSIGRTWAAGSLIVQGTTAAATPFSAARYELHSLDFGTLLRGSREASISTPSTQPLLLRAGEERGGWMYLVLGSMSGTAPGTSIGAGLELPLVDDPYFQQALWASAPIAGAFGTFDADGHGAAEFFVPPGTSPSFAGLSVHHAYVAIDPVTFEAHASNAVRVDLVN